MKRFYFLLTISLSLLLYSCADEELEATVPAYLKIDEIPVRITDPVQGSASADITDAWVFINDRLIGAFELPAIIPVLRTGDINLKIRGGIYNNGLSNQRVVYPFYEFYEIDTILVPEVIYDQPIVVEYKVGSVFSPEWAGEDFEQGVNFETNPNSDTTIVRVTNPDKVFEGNASGGVFLPVGTNFAEIYTTNLVDVPRIGTAVYLEMDYKSTHDIVVSIYTNNREQQFSVVNFRSTAEWTKVYIEFSKVFSTLFDANNYNIAIGMSKSTADNGELLLDNVKLIHF